MKFSGNMFFKVILKVTKNQDFILSLEDAFFEKNPTPSLSPGRFRVKEFYFTTFSFTLFESNRFCGSGLLRFPENRYSFKSNLLTIACL